MLITYCGNHFTIYAYIKSVGCASKTNTKVCVYYISIKLGIKRKFQEQYPVSVSMWLNKLEPVV